jgi:hypothetical protein
MAQDLFMEGFRKGEAMANREIDNLLEAFKNSYSPKVIPKKEDRNHATMTSFSGFTAAFVSTYLFRCHRELEKMLLADGKEPNEAELWVQKVWTLFVQVLMKEKVPVDCKFVIMRKKGG